MYIYSLIEACLSHWQRLEVTFSIENIPDSKMISSNYQYRFCFGDVEGSPEALVKTSRKTLKFEEAEIRKYIRNEQCSGTLAFEIKYVGHPRMRNKQYDSIGFYTVPTLGMIFKNSMFTDFKFIVRGKEFKVHKSVMASVSPMLLGMFTNDMAENKEGESKIDHIAPEVFDAMLKFVYRVEAPTVDYRDLYAAVHY